LLVLPAHIDATHHDNELFEQANEDITFEPSPQAVLEAMVPRLIESQLYQANLESIASEHSMRMMAMKNASDNATELIDDLTLAFNSARQAGITQELTEIISGAEAIQ
jgi:F-type H+-transporting ATPase subunit gamma